MKILVLNQKNLVPDGQNNKLVYSFPNSVQFKDCYIAVSSVSMYYSWFNITSQYLNNTFTYDWTQAGITTTYTVTIPDGLYEITTINDFLQYEMIQNGTYLINSEGSNVYFAEFILNPPRYAVQLNTYLVPTSFATYTVPTSATTGLPLAPPTLSFNPVITTPLNFCNIIGFVSTFASNSNVNNADPNPATAYVNKLPNGTFSYISTVAPQLQPNSAILFSMSNIDNKYAQPTSIIYSLVPAVAVGEIISEKPPQFMWNKLIDGTYNQLRLSLLGTDLAPIKINDPNMTFLLTIRDKDDLGIPAGK
jgi:hypothetical protein